jgi:hypothetical protein
MSRLARYAGVLGIAGLPLGAMLAVLLGVGGGWSGVLAGLVAGLAFGALVAVPAALADHLCQRRIGGPSLSGSPRQRLVVRSSEPVAALASALREGVFTLHATTVSDALPHGPLVAGVSAVRWGNGQRLTAELRRAAGGGTDVVLRSRPLLPTTLVDFGRGRRQVNHLARAVTA